MSRKDSPGELIAAIYDAVIDASRWDEVVRRIVQATKSLSGAVITEEAGAAHVTAPYNVDPFYANAYTQHYHEQSPFRPAAKRLSPGQLQMGSFLTQTEIFQASAFYNEFFRPQGWADAHAIGLAHTPVASTFLTLQRTAKAISFQPLEQHLLETLAPHMKRAAELHQLLAQSRAITHSLGAAISAAGFAVFLLTSECRVVFANAKAEDHLRRGAGLRYQRGRLAAAIPALTHRLHALAREAVRAGCAESANGGAVELPRASSAPLIAHLIPLAANRTEEIFALDRPSAALFVVDPAGDFSAAARQFGDRFGLTSAEGRVLADLLAGKGLHTTAARLGTSDATARTHLQRIFAKTGTHRQAELIRLFFLQSLPGTPHRI